MPAATSRTHAFLLRAVDYGESDRVVTLLTDDFGKVSALARGARKSRKRFGGALEPYSVIAVELAIGRGELWRLAEATIVEAFPAILASLSRMARGGTALELLREALPPREPVPAVFALTASFFAALGRDQGGGESLLLALQARLVGELGFAPELEVCGGCGRRALEGQAALFDAAKGSIVCRACGGGGLYLSGPARERLIRLKTAELLPNEPVSDKERAEIGLVLDGLIAHHIGRRLAGPAMLSQIEVRRRSDTT